MDAWFADGTGARLLEEEIFGTGDGARIAVIVDAFCAGSLGSPVERYEFFASSVLSVHGVRLADGRRVVIKAARREFGFEFLAATQTVVQSHLADHGFARPRPLGGPRPLVNGIVVAEERLSVAATPTLTNRRCDERWPAAGLRSPPGHPAGQVIRDRLAIPTRVPGDR